MAGVSQVFLERFEQQVFVQRFGEVAVAACFLRLLHVTFHGVRGESDDGDGGERLADLAELFPAKKVLLKRLEITKYKAELLRFHQPPRLQV